MKNRITLMAKTGVINISVPKSYLEENGVICYVLNENFGANYEGVYVELQVAEEDAEKAIKLLIEGGFLTEEDCKEYSDPLTRFVSRLFGEEEKEE